MFGRTKTQAVKDHAATSKEFALALSRDKKFRKQLLSAIGHGAKAKRRAAKGVASWPPRHGSRTTSSSGASSTG